MPAAFASPATTGKPLTSRNGQRQQRRADQQHESRHPEAPGALSLDIGAKVRKGEMKW